MRIIFALLAAAAFTNVAAAQPDAFDPEDLWSQATLYRDEWGVPHVYAQSVKALAFAFGYAQAEDHLEPMLLAYRVAKGRAAEVLGEGWAESDEFSIRVGHTRLAQRALAAADPVTADLCAGFALGVNAWIVEHPDGIPPWVEGVQAQDVLALWHAYLTSHAPFDLPGIWSRQPAAHTGNAWAVAPQRTEDGKALLVINPHQHHDGPFRWYEAHLALDDMDIAGATLFGLPVILQGHNPVLGWALTPNQVDFADVFEERIPRPQANPADPRMIESEAADQLPLLMYYSQAQPYYVRTDTGMEERVVPSLISDRGPVFESGGALYSWQVGGFRDLGGFLQLVEMARARNLDAFQAALGMQQLPCFHVVYADQPGNLFYLYNAVTGAHEIPDQFIESNVENDVQLSWKIPVPAFWAMNTWGRIVTPGELPFFANPTSGFIQACGNPPWAATDEAPISADWPAWFIGDPDTYRANRVRQLLRSGQRNFRDMQSMLYDNVAPAARSMGERLLAFAKAQPERVQRSHPDLAECLQLIDDWNYTAELKAEGMTFYHLWWSMLRARSTAEFGTDAAAYAALLSDSEQAQGFALDAAADAARMLRNDFDRVAIPWGEAHVIRRGVRTEPLFGSGTGEPLFVASDYRFADETWESTYGYGFAMAVEFDSPPRAVSMVPFGASENPDSPHFDDQLDLMIEKRFKITRYTRDDVLRNAARGRGRSVVLLPLGVTGELQVRAPTPIEARVETLAETPGPLPGNTVPFSLYVDVQRTPETTPVEVDLAFHVPEELCDLERLYELRVYGYEPGIGWRILPEQTVDEPTRTFRATYNAAAFAVLGPSDARKGVTPAEESAPAEDTDNVVPADSPGTDPEPTAEPESEPPTDTPAAESDSDVETPDSS